MTKTISIFLILVLITAFTHAQVRQAFPGTKYSIIPPVGFEPAPDFGGFINEDNGASLFLIQYPGPVDSMTDALSESKIKAQGLSLINKQIIDFNNSKATYLTVNQQANGIPYLKQILVFGNSQNTAFASGVYPERHKEVEQEIKKALLSTKYEEDLGDNANIAANFIIDLSGGLYKATKFIAGSVIYTQDGKMPTQRPSIFITRSPSPVAPQNRKQVSIDHFTPTPDPGNFAIKSVAPIRIDNMEGYEIVAERKSKTETMYQVTLFGEDSFYIIFGSAAEDEAKSIEDFKRIARTFQRR